MTKLFLKIMNVSNYFYSRKQFKKQNCEMVKSILIVLHEKIIMLVISLIFPELDCCLTSFLPTPSDNVTLKIMNVSNYIHSRNQFDKLILSVVFFILSLDRVDYQELFFQMLSLFFKLIQNMMTDYLGIS